VERGPRSPLHGVWNVERMSVNGEQRPPVTNDYDRRWRRFIVDDPDRATFQRTDDSFAHYALALDAEARSLELTKGGSRTWRARFVVQQAEGRLQLNGEMDGQQIEVHLRRVEFDTYRLLNSRFRWVRAHATPD
jgi:hypothetical protein